MTWRKYVAPLQAGRRLLFGQNGRVLVDIVNRLSEGASNCWRTKDFVLMIGFSKSGKNTLIKRNPQLQHYFRISSDAIHAELNRAFRWLRDDETVTGPAYWQRQFLTGMVRRLVLLRVLTRGYSVVQDSCNLSQFERLGRLGLAKKHGYDTTIIWVTCHEPELIRRLQIADDDKVRQGGKPAWVDLYRRVQLPRFQPPTAEEADRIVTFNSGVQVPERLQL